MNQSNCIHGINDGKASVLIAMMQETNFSGHTFCFQRATCAQCGKRLGDSSPVLAKKTLPLANPTKRIAIQKMTCGSKNRCKDGEITADLRDEMNNLENIIDKYCKNCRHMLWENKNIFPYTAENLGACKV